MKYVLVLSLEQIALIKLTTTLWNQDDIRALMVKFYLPSSSINRNKIWQNAEDKVTEKVLQLEQPELFKDKILGLVKPIGSQILKWIKYHRDPYFGVTNLPDKFSWTPQGTIDRKKTAEMLIEHDNNLDVVQCYKLACNYCLKDTIVELWNKIPAEYRRCIESDDFTIQFPLQDLSIYMTYDALKEVDKMKEIVEDRFIHTLNQSPYVFIFGCAANSGNKPAAEYFFQKVSSEERGEALIWATLFMKKRLYDCLFKRTEFPKEYYVEVLLFLLSNMTEEEQLKLIRCHAYEVLKSFLDWPFQKFFFETAHYAWDFLNTVHFDCMLEVITDKIVNGYKDWNYQMLFKEFWRRSLDTHKKFCVCRCTSNSILLLNLFKMNAKENIEVILKCATVKEKEEIIFNYNGKNICENLIYSQNFDALFFFLQQCISSKNVMNKFKVEFRKHIKSHHPAEKLEEERDMWSNLFQLLDDFSSSLR